MHLFKRHSLLRLLQLALHHNTLTLSALIRRLLNNRNIFRM